MAVEVFPQVLGKETADEVSEHISSETPAGNGSNSGLFSSSAYFEDDEDEMFTSKVFSLVLIGCAVYGGRGTTALYQESSCSTASTLPLLLSRRRSLRR